MSDLDKREERIAEALAEGNEVVHGSPTRLIFDFDDCDEMPDLKDKLEIFCKYIVIHGNIQTWRSRSGTGWHAMIETYCKIPLDKRIAIQAAFGSDWKKELLTVLQEHGEPFLIRPGLKQTVELMRRINK